MTWFLFSGVIVSLSCGWNAEGTDLKGESHLEDLFNELGPQRNRSFWGKFLSDGAKLHRIKLTTPVLRQAPVNSFRVFVMWS